MTSGHDIHFVFTLSLRGRPDFQAANRVSASEAASATRVIIHSIAADMACAAIARKRLAARLSVRPVEIVELEFQLDHVVAVLGRRHDGVPRW